MNWYLEALKKYAVFGGRARRKEYWYFVLFNILISIGLMVADVVTGSFSAEAGMGLLGGIYTLGVLIPSIAPRKCAPILRQIAMQMYRKSILKLPLPRSSALQAAAKASRQKPCVPF